MPPRSQILMISGTLAIGMIVGSLAIAVLRPAVPTKPKAAPKAEERKAQIARLTGPVRAEAALKVAKPVLENAAPAAPAGSQADKPAPERVAVAIANAPSAGPRRCPCDRSGHRESAPQPERPKPEGVLANKGLRRSGQVYVLNAETDIRKKSDEFVVTYNAELGPINQQLSRLEMEAKAQQRALDQLVQNKTNLQVLIAKAGMNRNGAEQPRNAPIGQQQGNNNGQWTVLEMELNSHQGRLDELQQRGSNLLRLIAQVGMNRNRAQQPRVNGPLNANLGGMNAVGGQQEPKKENLPGRAIDAIDIALVQAQITELGANISQTENNMFQFEIYWNTCLGRAERITSVFQGNMVLLNREYNDLKTQYDELRKDPLVTRALVELNRNPGPTVVLGPEEDFWVNFKKMHESLLVERGLVPIRDKGIKKLETVEDKNAQQLWDRTVESDEALQRALKTRKNERTLSTSRKQHLADWPRDKAEFQRKNNMAGLKNAEKGIEDDEQKEKQWGATRQILSQDVLARYRAFVENLAALDKALTASRHRHEDLVKKPRPKQAGKASGWPIASISKDLEKYLDKAKKRTRTEQIKLDPDKAIFSVEVILNENKESRKTMVIDPSKDEIRISEGFAAGLGIRPLVTDPSIDVVAGDGQTFSARRIKLKAVQVGSFKINDVECLVFSKGYEGPPLLGTSFLDNFIFELDAGEAKLMLAKAAAPY